MSRPFYALRVMARKLLQLSRKPKERQLFLKMLREARENADMLQEDVAKALGTTQAFVSKYELGERRLDFLDLARICDALGVSLSEFVGLFEEKRRKL